ncbi:MAG: AraC family transcriptional regulator [Cyanobacteria bacterium J06638_20]
MNTGVEVAHLHKTDIPGVELFNARLLNHSFDKHFHDSYTIGISHRGEGRFWWKGKIYNTHPGEFHLINPGDVHTGQVGSREGWSFCNLYLSIFFAEKILRQLERDTQGLPTFTHPTISDASLKTAFYYLLQLLGDRRSQLEVDTCILDVFAQLFLRHTKCNFSLTLPKQETRAVTEVRDYLEAHYAENISIDVLSNLVNLSPHYLIRCFHRQVGLPPHRYQRNWQLLQAKQALRTHQPLSKIAMEQGFYDQSHLTRYFKRMFGVTPAQYRKDSFVQDA